jgi:hypothetical protein
VGDVGRRDGFVRKGPKEVAVMLHLRPSHVKVTGSPGSQVISSAIAECRLTAGAVNETMLKRVSE